MTSLVVTIDGATVTCDWPAGERLLDVLVDNGVNPPFSCRQGTCGACAVRVVAGEVEMLHNEVLEEEDFAEGYVLACQSVPISDLVEIDYS
ncbi:MAG: 2Fe-2S iron-sulfur cluster binding domain-containing protein [Hamadaea sp.]|nr:2Fe-2S iron-sulfur cluster binding domain-containing protein [Hamadaea sp.]